MMRNKKTPWWIIGPGMMLEVIVGFFVIMLLAILFVQACGDDEPPIEMYNQDEIEKVDSIKVEGA